MLRGSSLVAIMAAHRLNQGLISHEIHISWREWLTSGNYTCWLLKVWFRRLVQKLRSFERTASNWWNNRTRIGLHHSDTWLCCLFHLTIGVPWWTHLTHRSICWSSLWSRCPPCWKSLLKGRIWTEELKLSRTHNFWFNRTLLEDLFWRAHVHLSDSEPFLLVCRPFAKVRHSLINHFNFHFLSKQAWLDDMFLNKWFLLLFNCKDLLFDANLFWCLLNLCDMVLGSTLDPLETLDFNWLFYLTSEYVHKLMLWIRVELLVYLFSFDVRPITIVEHVIYSSLLSHCEIMVFHDALDVIYVLSRTLLPFLMIIKIIDKFFTMSFIDFLYPLYLSL